MNNATFTTSPDDCSLIMERVFPVSANRLWDAYADAELLAQWFSPRGWETHVRAHQFVNGGQFSYVMKCTDEAQNWFGQTSSGMMRFENINPKTSFEYVDVFTDEDGVVNEEMPTSHSFVTISPTGENASILKVVTRYATPEALAQLLAMGMEAGFAETLDKLEELLGSA